ncbi:MAG: phage tail tube protein [Syntrophobacteraceae bacterium]
MDNVWESRPGAGFEGDAWEQAQEVIDMSEARGFKASLLGGVRESAFGVSPGAIDATALPIVSSGIKASRNTINTSVLRGRRDPAKPFRGNVDVAGDVVVPVDRIAIGYWLQMLLGDPTTTGTSTYTHTFKVGDSQPSWVLEHAYDDVGVYLRYNGCKASTFKIDVGGDGELTATFGVMGAGEIIGSSSMDSSPSVLSYNVFNQFDAAIQEGGATSAIITNASISINNNLDGSIYVIGGGGKRARLPEGMIEVTGSVKALFDDSTLLTKATNGTESALSITFTSGSYSLNFLIQELMLEQSSPGISTPGGLFVELNFTGYYEDGAAGSSFQATLVNNHAAYAA